MDNPITPVSTGKLSKIPAVILLFLFPALILSFPSSVRPEQARVDKVVVIKSKRIMLLLSEGEILKSYKVSLGKQPTGRKVMGGDQKTPEGIYRLDLRNPSSNFHMSIHISYPNEADLANARQLGVQPGNGIMIHGLPDDLAELGKLQRRWDWTDGCIAVSNPEIEEIWRLVPDGTTIEIRP